MTHDELPPLSAVDRRDKMELWLAVDVLEQGKYDIGKFYELLESHFALVSTWRKLENKHAKLPKGYEPTNTRTIERF